MRIRQRALILESENFSNSSHGNPLGWHAALLEQKGASVTTLISRITTHRAVATNGPDQNSDDLERLVEDRERRSDRSDKSFTFRRKLRSTSSESRSRSVGTTVQLRSEYTLEPTRHVFQSNRALWLLAV